MREVDRDRWRPQSANNHALTQLFGALRHSVTVQSLEQAC
jgi:hypothetical protein